jgi:hypothetical protein
LDREGSLCSSIPSHSSSLSLFSLSSLCVSMSAKDDLLPPPPPGFSNGAAESDVRDEQEGRTRSASVSSRGFLALALAAEKCARRGEWSRGLQLSLRALTAEDAGGADGSADQSKSKGAALAAVHHQVRFKNRRRRKRLKLNRSLSCSPPLSLSLSLSHTRTHLSRFLSVCSVKRTVSFSCVFSFQCIKR